MQLNMDSSKIAKILGTVGSPLIVISELVKNAFDASAKNIDIVYDREKREISITNDCSGFSDNDIKDLDKPGESSKKVGDNLQNKEGLFLTGSKGLGLLSVFLLCDEAEIYTANSNSTTRKIVLQKRNGSVTVDDIGGCSDSSFTKIIMKNVSEDNIDFLSSATEIKKLRHISTFLYKNDKIPFPNITLKLGNEAAINPVNFNCNIKPPLYDVYFDYKKNNKEMSFKCISQNKLIKQTQVKLNSFSLGALNNFILKEYNISKTIKTRTNDTMAYYDSNNVPDFEGRLLVYEKNLAGDQLKEYGAGVNIYVNDFALYNYLNEENDWLGLADFSQRKKSTRLKPHNVFGYVNFPNFNENVERLKISNERADFIQDIIFNKLMYLLKGVVMFLIFNIDLEMKNSKIINNRNGNHENENYNLESDEKDSDRVDDKKNSVESDYQSQQTDIVSSLDNSDDEYIPESTYKPIHKKDKFLVFTKEEGELIEKLKNVSNESQKIFNVVYELSTLDVAKYRYSVVALFRTLLESATKYYFIKNRLEYPENNLEGAIRRVIQNVGSVAGQSNKELSKKCKTWNSELTIINALNLYIHHSDPINVLAITEYWKTFKSYVLKCIE